MVSSLQFSDAACSKSSSVSSGVTQRSKRHTTRTRHLDGFMHYYNTERPHQGYRVRGRTPAALVWGVAAAQ